MQAAFFHDSKMLTDGEGDQYSVAFPYSLWESRYLPHFDGMTVSTRVFDWESCPPEKRKGYRKSNGDGVSMRPIPAYRELPDALFHRKAIRKQVSEGMEGADCAVIRLPSIIGSYACKEARRRGIPYAVELTECILGSLWRIGRLGGKPLAPILFGVTRRAVRKAPSVLYVTQEYLQRRYPTNGRTAAISDAVLAPAGDEVLRAREARIARLFDETRDAPIVFGLVGTLDVRYKGHETAIRALGKLRARLPKFTLELVGPGDPSRWQKLAEKVGIGDCVKFRGTLPSGQVMLDWYDHLDVLLIPSLQEALPRVLVEAMSRGCPAVGSKAGGIPELLPPGMLHQRGSVGALRECIEDLLADEQVMLQAARDNFEKSKEFDPETLNERRHAFFETLAEDVRRCEAAEGGLRRVLMVVGKMDRGGVESMLMNLYRAVDRTRIQFDFLCTRPGDAEFDDEIRALGGRIFHLPTIESVGRRGVAREMTKIMRLEGPFAAVHAHVMFFNGIALRAAKKAGISKRISHAHATGHLKYKTLVGRAYAAVMRLMVRHYATDWLTCGDRAGRYLYGKRAVKRDKVHLLANAVNLDEYLNPPAADALNAELSLPADGTPVIATVGRMIPEKNQAFLFDILTALSEEGKKAVLVLAGDGELRGALEQRAQELGLSDRVRFAGMRRDIPTLLGRIDAFVLPSLFEGLPVSVIEAQAAAVPCLLSEGVSREADMGLGLVRFLSLDAGAQAWGQALLEQVQCKRPGEEEIRAALGKRGYDVAKNVSSLYDLYNA